MSIHRPWHQNYNYFFLHCVDDTILPELSQSADKENLTPYNDKKCEDSDSHFMTEDLLEDHLKHSISCQNTTIEKEEISSAESGIF